MNIALIYFNFPFWRAEVARISLFIANKDFKDIRITREEFLRVKESGTLDNGIKIPFHQLPCLVINNDSVAQTAGIARFCGKISNLYPLQNNIDAVKIDQFIDFATDITFMISFTKPEDRKNNFLEGIQKKLFILNKHIDTKCTYLVNNTISIADITIWSLMCWLTSGKIDGIPVNIIQNFKNISNICLAVDRHPKVNEWVKKTFPENYPKNLS